MATQSLVVSSDPEVLGRLRPVLVEMGMGIDTCLGANDAYSLLQTKKYDTVIVDCDRDADGLGLLSAIRQQQSTEKTVAVGITSSYHEIQNVFNSGATFVLSKPLPVEDARRILRISKGVVTRVVRRFLRMPVDSFATVTLGDHHEAVILNISQGGLAIHAAQPLEAGKMIYVTFFLPETFVLVESMVRVMWADEQGRAGLEFCSLTDESHDQLSKWITTKVKGERPDPQLETLTFEETEDTNRETLSAVHKMKGWVLLAAGGACDLAIVAAATLLIMAFGFMVGTPRFDRTHTIFAITCGSVLWLLYRSMYYFAKTPSPGEKLVHRLTRL